MSNAYMAQLPHIGSTTTLGWQNDELARSYMDHILQRASVLLPRRGWRVGIIKEFYPRGASLLGLNVNAGSEVCVRFRIPGNRNAFLPFHEVLCTALHEFTHCVHSRHDRAFWNLYYDLVKECEALEVSMIAEGKQLYPEATHTPMTPSTKAAAASKAATRGKSKTAAARGGLTSRGGAGHRLGGPTSGARGGTATRSRGGTMTLTERPGTSLPTTTTRTTDVSPTPRRGSSDTSGASASRIFPGEGRRLGEGGGLRRFDIPPGATPTRDALRQILADAAERRGRREGGQRASEALPRDTARGAETAPVGVPAGDDDHVDGDGCVEEGEVPDHIPVSQGGEEPGDDSWRCPRCGFSNEAGSHMCQFCADDNDDDLVADDDEALTALLVSGEAAGDGAPPLKVARITEPPATTVGSSPASPATLVPPDGATREDAVEVSDDEP